VWEASGVSRRILCDGISRNITPNLHDALPRLRLNSEAPRLNLWIDSLYIDQTSNEERPYQVTLMTQIHSQAEMVTVWLGEN
ncbi:hypothetical protein L207DRAFT_382867, partial [Hyaloscypha variabilis F]